MPGSFLLLCGFNPAGRPAKQLDTFDEIYQQWKSGNMTATFASEQLNVSRSTFYRKVSEHEKNDIPIGFERRT
jgi:hypothetical protein